MFPLIWYFLVLPYQFAQSVDRLYTHSFCCFSEFLHCYIVNAWSFVLFFDWRVQYVFCEVLWNCILCISKHFAFHRRLSRVFHPCKSGPAFSSPAFSASPCQQQRFLKCLRIWAEITETYLNNVHHTDECNFSTKCTYIITSKYVDYATASWYIYIRIQKSRYR